MVVELKLIEGLPHHKIPKAGYDIIFLLAKSEEAPWLEPQEISDYVFGIFRNTQPEEENPLVNIEHAFSLTEMDCSRLVKKLKERPGFGHRFLPYKTEASGVSLNLQRIASDHYWISVELTPYGVSGKDLSLISKLFEI